MITEPITVHIDDVDFTSAVALHRIANTLEAFLKLAEKHFGEGSAVAGMGPGDGEGAPSGAATEEKAQ